MRWPWVALKVVKTKLDRKPNNLSKSLRLAESYLKDQFPQALVSQSLLKENLRESTVVDDDVFSQAQGELLGFGITRYARIGGTGRKIGGLWKRLCIVFPTGESRTQIGTS